MENKTNRKLYPKSVLALYLKLYCKRTNTKKNKMMEGIKSWLNLSKIEKQHFYNKYKEYQISYKNKLADYLKTTVPFMKKKKNIEKSSGDYNRKKEPVLELLNSMESQLGSSNDVYINAIETAQGVNVDDEHVSVCDNVMSSQNDQLQPCNRSEAEARDIYINRDRQQYSEPILAEPSAPKIKTARELFEMLNARNEFSETWTSLSNTQKSRYRRAVQLLKSDYITKYKAYLESLPSKELFDYYINFFD